MFFGAIIATVVTVSVYAINASSIEYKNDKNVSEALDDLYTTQNTTVSDLQQSVSDKDTTISSLNSRISELENQIDSQNNAVTVSFNIPATGTVTNNVGFRPTFISCSHRTSQNKTSIAAYDANNGNNVVIASYDGAYVDVYPLATYFTVTDTGFIYNFSLNDSQSAYYNAPVYCTVSK